MKDSEMIELCLGIACKAHKGQIDKVGCLLYYTLSM